MLCFAFFPLEQPSCDETVASISSLNGTSTLLPCIVRGNPAPEVNWFKVNNPTQKLDQRFVVTPKGLLVNSLSGEDSGQYQVTLRNSAGSYNFITVLDVKCKLLSLFLLLYCAIMVFHKLAIFVQEAQNFFISDFSVVFETRLATN